MVTRGANLGAALVVWQTLCGESGTIRGVIWFNAEHDPMRRLHLIVGLAGVAAFLGTGQYMDRWHDHLRGMADAQRMLFRSTHIYLLWASLLNVVAGLYLAGRAGWRRVPQNLGSCLLLLAPATLLVAFSTEPWLDGLDRPYSRPAIYGSLAGVILHLVAAGADRRPNTTGAVADVPPN